MLSIDGYEITDRWEEYAVVISEGEYGEVSFDCIDEEDALQMQHAFGGKIVVSKIFRGAWHELPSKSEDTST